MRNAVAFANHDVVTIAWSFGKRPDDCMGFALYRIDAQGKETVLPSHAVFKGYPFGANHVHLHFRKETEAVCADDTNDLRFRAALGT
jgi:hypothetical protein